MTDPTLLTIAEAAKLIAARKLSPVELTEACLAKTRRLDNVLSAYVEVTEESALAAARDAEAAAAKGTLKSPLHGIPIGLKDIYDTAGVKTTGHSKLLKDRVPKEDATTVANLKAAGAVLTGKLGTFEFAIGGPSFDILTPPARNPWNPDHTTGGSSSGSGAAVAAGLVLGAMGTDTGGSIRSPSALCGLSGIKPTYGILSRKGILPLSQSLDHAGPMCWTSEDCALMMQALASHDPGDPASAKVPLPDFSGAIGKPVKGLKIGLVRHFYETDHPATDEVKAAIEASAAVFRSLGCEVVDVTLPPLADFAAVGLTIMGSEAYAIHEKSLKESPELYGEYARDRITLGAFFTGADYVAASYRRRELCAAVAKVMGEVDVLLTAASCFPAPRIEQVPKWFLFQKPSITMPFNVTGLPALAVCCGYSAAGLPLSMQLVGRAFAEPTLFGLGDAYEKATPWRSRRPELTLAA
ncbi:amidase [Prosthecomicrobium sp. N25]|uniref:amidase n=1 Tax=Prosthecomicrobium sp. N25 TaxID=3129254 RepID=UPI003076CBA1